MFRSVRRNITVTTFALGMIAVPITATTVPAAAAVEKTADQMVAGKVLGVSKKAKTISINTKKGPVMISYTDHTQGLEFATKGHAAKVFYREEDGRKIATVIKPKLAKLPPGVTEIQPDELYNLIQLGPEKGNYFLADARPAGRFAAGAIPTAVSVPVEELKKKGEALLPADKNKLVIFYCGGVTCGLSTKNAALAKKLGYTNVKVMLKGAPGWKKAGYPLVASDEFVRSGNIVLVDLRSEEEAAKGHIKRAVNIPMEELPDMGEMFPSSMAAPIVLYGNDDDAERAAGIVLGWGYKTVSVVNGGLKGWQSRGNGLVTGPAATDIEWVRKPGKDEVSIADFTKAVHGGTSDVVILDVRNPDEVGAGCFPSAINIPLDEIGTRLAELPKDKQIYVHCTTGARAEMACRQLLQAGFKARYLVATVNCADGNCSIEE